VIKTQKVPACDFCGKDHYRVEALIAGPNSVMICNECIDLCNGIISEQRAEKASKQGENANPS
jgi:ATP-dependent Clp protease ATP-binding subunit ClpX